MIKKFMKEFFTDTFILDEYGLSQASSIRQFISFFVLFFIISLFPFIMIDIITYFSTETHKTHLLINLTCLSSVFIGNFFIMVCSYFLSKRYGVRGFNLCFNTMFWWRILVYSPVLIIKAERERKLKVIEEIMNS